jgi:aspartate/glutamate racemase
MKTLHIIAPDQPSGENFRATIAAHGIDTHMDVVSIAPRVIGDRINTDASVVSDLATALSAGCSNCDAVAIACNTLQLWLPQVAVKPQRVITTFEAVTRLFPVKATRPVWLGTTVLVRELNKRDEFPTLLSLGNHRAQKVVQEIIWRVKAVFGADVTTAHAMEEIRNSTILRDRVTLLGDLLQLSGVRRIILGCTELPIAVHAMGKPYSFKGIEVFDPAALLAVYLKNLTNPEAAMPDA